MSEHEKTLRTLRGLIRTVDYLCIMIGLPLAIHLWAAFFK